MGTGGYNEVKVVTPTMTDTEAKTDQTDNQNRQGCPYCSWIDPERLEDDPEDGPQNFCRVCGRYLRNPGEIGTKID